MIKTILTIDPGKAGTGYCLWSYENFKNKILKAPLKYGIIFNKDTNKQFRTLEQLLIEYNPIEVYIEDASFMYSSAKTQAVANTGSLVTLAEYIGQVMMLCKRLSCKVTLIKVAQWKGTLPKEIVWFRVKKKLPTLQATSHAQDAIGIGMYLQGFINQGTKVKKEVA